MEIYRMQCLETDELKIKQAFEKYNCTFAEMYSNITKLLKNKQLRTYEEDLFIDVQLNEQFWPGDYRKVFIEIFTIFTRMYPEITFRLYEMTWDLDRCSTYIFRGNEYAFEKELQDFERNRVIEINGMKFYSSQFKSYHPENFDVILDILDIEVDLSLCGVIGGSMEPYEFCCKYVTPAADNLEFKEFVGFDQKFIKLVESWSDVKPVQRSSSPVKRESSSPRE